MKLSRGVTGFWHITDKAPPEFINESDIEKVIKQIEFPFFLKHNRILRPDYSSNYWRISIVNQIENKTIDLLINCSYWLICSIEPSSHWMNLRFIDTPVELEKQLLIIKPGIQCISKIILDSNVNSGHLVNLSKTEVAQISYWRSKTIGEIVFNVYD